MSENTLWTDEHSAGREALRHALAAEDDLGAVVRAQVIIEYYLRKAIESALHDKSLIKSGTWNNSLTFKVRKELFYALGAARNREQEESLDKLAKIRNNLAHNVGAAVTEAAARDFIAGLNEGQRRQLDAERMSDDTWRDDFRRALWIHVVDIQVSAEILRARYDQMRPTIGKGLQAYPFVEINEMDAIPLDLIIEEPETPDDGS